MKVSIIISYLVVQIKMLIIDCKWEKKKKMVVVSLKMKQYCLGCNQEKLAEYTN